ncbi:hypothetical protein FRB94_000598 [Tulasnella sp. JGI-2019a]|nr:hypothetical protein FRB94_000598 [Tulasnella sp. JGI-2019a]
MLTLQHFILKGQVFSLYRTFIRTSRGISDPHARRETIRWIRGEFELHRYERDVKQIKSLVAHGRRSLKQYFPGAAMR